MKTFAHEMFVVLAMTLAAIGAFTLASTLYVFTFGLPGA